MSGQITSELLQRLVAVECDAEAALLAAKFIEHPRGGMQMFLAILSGFEKREVGDTFADFFKRFWAALSWPERRAPANDEVSRMGSSQRRAAYAKLIDRDGEACQECARGASTIWRRMGVFCTETEARYTKVWPTSNLEVDHRLPLWAGGDNDLENLWLLCIECHKQKTSREASERRRA